MKEKVLVTGGAGFIGSHIVDLLIKKRYKVVVVDNLSSGFKENINPRTKFYLEDIKNSLEIFEREKPDYLVHHAAQINVRESIKNPVYDAEQNIIGTISLLEACRRFKVKKVIFASSGGTIYGNPKMLPTKENAKPKPLSPYGVAKLAAEEYLEFYFQNFGLNYVSLRYGNVYGPRQNPKAEAGIISVFCEKMLRQEVPCIWGDGQQTRDFVYVDDVARANLLVLDYNSKHRTFNIGTGKETSINQMFEILRGYISCERAVYDYKYKELIRRVCLDCSLASQELGWKATTSLEEGIKKQMSGLLQKDNHERKSACDRWGRIHREPYC